MTSKKILSILSIPLVSAAITTSVFAMDNTATPSDTKDATKKVEVVKTKVVKRHHRKVTKKNTAKPVTTTTNTTSNGTTTSSN